MYHCKQFCRPFAILEIFNGYIHFLRLLFVVCLVVMMVVMTAICFVRCLRLLIRLNLILLTNRISQYSHTAPENIDHVFGIYHKHLLPIEVLSLL
jgi:hypothetical protein